ncbi:hypothetical protein SDC9_125267 [bioreactor metagenome]|uniref:Uncharacterized protein n=1 Tax=bioreactor metagenome TaxID=1076179 RepID=A0A645CMK7_9ZZZZ
MNSRICPYCGQGCILCHCDCTIRIVNFIVHAGTPADKHLTGWRYHRRRIIRLHLRLASVGVCFRIGRRRSARLAQRIEDVIGQAADPDWIEHDIFKYLHARAKDGQNAVLHHHPAAKVIGRVRFVRNRRSLRRRQRARADGSAIRNCAKVIRSTAGFAIRMIARHGSKCRRIPFCIENDILCRHGLSDPIEFRALKSRHRRIPSGKRKERTHASGPRRHIVLPLYRSAIANTADRLRSGAVDQCEVIAGATIIQRGKIGAANIGKGRHRVIPLIKPRDRKIVLGIRQGNTVCFYRNRLCHVIGDPAARHRHGSRRRGRRRAVERLQAIVPGICAAIPGGCSQGEVIPRHFFQEGIVRPRNA